MASKADELIAKAKSVNVARLPPKMHSELAKIIAHNDQAPIRHRVAASAAIELLASHGIVMGRVKFDSVIVREFGRKWGSK